MKDCEGVSEEGLEKASDSRTCLKQRRRSRSLSSEGRCCSARRRRSSSSNGSCYLIWVSVSEQVWRWGRVSYPGRLSLKVAGAPG